MPTSKENENIVSSTIRFDRTRWADFKAAVYHAKSRREGGIPPAKNEPDATLHGWINWSLGVAIHQIYKFHPKTRR